MLFLESDLWHICWFFHSKPQNDHSLCSHAILYIICWWPKYTRFNTFCRCLCVCVCVHMLLECRSFMTGLCFYHICIPNAYSNAQHTVTINNGQKKNCWTTAIKLLPLLFHIPSTTSPGLLKSLWVLQTVNMSLCLGNVTKIQGPAEGLLECGW